MNDLGLVEAIDRLGEGIVVTVTDAADGRFDTRLGEALGVSDADVLRPPVGMVHQPGAMNGPAFVQRLLQRVQYEVGVCRPADALADNAPGVGIDHEGHINEPGPRTDVGKIR